MNDTGRRILLNCDMGESFGAWRMGDDVHSMPLVDQANLACGFHAGDPLTMRRAVELAVRHGVSIGAHPAYPDLSGFGRRSLACSAEEVHAMVLYQIGALDAFCRSLGAQVAYVKPHGALYNDLVGDDELLRAVLDACRFAHYLKCIVRDKIGSFKEKDEMQRWLQDWILNYVDGDPAHSTETTKAQHPLAAAEVVVEEVEGNPGYYNSKFFLRPHYQLEGLTVSLRLVSKLPSAKEA